MRPRTLIPLLALSVATLALAAPAHAQSEAENKAAARALGLDGIRLAADGNCEAALDKLERADKLYYAPTIAVWLGECQIKLGKLVAGTETLQRIVREPLASNAPDSFRTSQARAQELLTATLPRLAKLTVNVQAPAGATYEVTLDGGVLPSVLVGVERPIDPGAHELGASGAGLVTVREAITLPEGQADTLTLTLLPAPASAPAPSGAPSPAGAPAPTTTDGSRAPRPHGSGLRTGGIVALSLGGLGLVAGSAFGVSATNKRNDLDAQCPAKQCPPEAASDIDAMKSAANVSTAGFVIGGLGVAAGTTLLILAGRGHEAPVAHERRRPVHATPFVGVGVAGVTGSFR